MKCQKCNASIMKKPLQRVNEKGVKGIWWCWDCIKKYESELYNNLKEDQSEVEKDLIKIFYPKTTIK